ncbi:MAG: DUF4340 domain-containing protein [Spirochaetaceae bacterium]|nr:DUF4340 domain-containing protein [Spirochaetaceae bacterium]MCF7948898.1 DUF4340 domain-containing protein [Spirochaetia bacterium]MCF7951299.1 DUF4340 domain-containing protein [Spirochaetaceae bacterium]
MSYKGKILILSALALLLLGTYSLGPLFTSSDNPRLSPQPWLQNVDAESITKLDFFNQEFSLVRNVDMEGDKQSPAWYVVVGDEKYPADGKKVEAFTDRIAHLAYYYEAAASPDNWSGFSVDDRNGQKLRIFTSVVSEPQETIVFGESLQGSDRQYARKISSDSTYEVDDLSRYLESGTAYWSDLALFSEKLSIQDVISIEFIIEEEGRYSFQRSESGLNQIEWILRSAEASSTEAVDIETMNRHIRNLIELRGEKYAPPKERPDSGIAKPRIIISFETATGKIYRLRVGNKNNRQQVYVRPNQSQYTYLISEWRLNTILNPLQELLPLQAGGEE